MKEDVFIKGMKCINIKIPGTKPGISVWYQILGVLLCEVACFLNRTPISISCVPVL